MLYTKEGDKSREEKSLLNPFFTFLAQNSQTPKMVKEKNKKKKEFSGVFALVFFSIKSSIMLITKCQQMG